MSPPFFLTGLPRSRLSWLANLLTTGRSFCHHAALATCATMSEYEEIMAGSPDGAEFVGDADPLIPLVARDFSKAFEGCRLVVVLRNMEEALEEEEKAIKTEGLSFDYNRLENLYCQTSENLSILFSFTPEHLRMWVPYPDLDKVETIRSIWRFCLPEMRFPEERYRMLDMLRVTQMCRKFLAANPDQRFKKMLEEKEKALCGAQ